MLWTIFIILLVLWLLGMVSSYTMGGFIHVLLVIAVVIVLNAWIGFRQERSSPPEGTDLVAMTVNLQYGWADAAQVTQAVRDSSCDAGPISAGDWLGIARDGIRAEQPFGDFAQGRARQGRIESLQGVQFQHRGRRGPGTGRRRRRGNRCHGQGVQLGRERAIARARRGAGPSGVKVGHAVLQARRKREPQAAAWPVRHQHQALAIVDQLLAPRHAPELEGKSDMHHAAEP